MRERWERKRAGVPALQVAGGYALLGAVATGLAVALRDGVPWELPDPWLRLRPPAALLTSALLGLVLAGGVIASTRVAVARYAWARRLSDELRPVAASLSLGEILLLAGMSSLGEELSFRGLLVPWLGVAGSSLLFGLAHQMRGPSRWVWAGWATAVGVALGSIFALTGSLLGPLLAHAVVNAVNLVYLRDRPAPAGARRPA